MNYEKAYKEALERAREFQKSKDGLCVLTAESIFPELKESEDEKIRKGIIDFLWKEKIFLQEVHSSVENNPKYRFVMDAIAWLEKQGEKKATDKVEPKFKVGDWIINDQGSAFQIAYIDEENQRYVFEIGGYTKEQMNYENIEFADNHYHLWTIEDAKDGDVLACGDKVYDCPFIFHNLTEKQNPRSYCGVNTLHHFQDNDENGGYWCNSDEVRPATKEQRDLLFAKMKEAGYQWNPDKKELKLLISNGGDFESNNSKQKPTWSDEDKMMLNELIIGFYAYKDLYPNFWKLRTDEIIEWLKKKKDEHTTDNG